MWGRRKAGNPGVQCGHGCQGGRTYNQARSFNAKRAIFKAKNDERKRFCEDLERENDKDNLFNSG